MTNTTPVAPQQPQYQQAPPSNTMATASLVLGIVSLVANLLLVPTILGLIFGIVGLNRAPRLGGRNKAIVGIVLSVVGAVIGISLFASLMAGIGHAASALASDDTVASQPAAAAPSDDSATTDEPSAAAPASTAPAAPAVSPVFVAALAKAQSYANDMNMSKKAVYDQLVSSYGEKFPKAAAQYAIDHVKADWNANALAKAKSYEKDMSMSPAAIRDQLVSSYGEKFTAAQADYAIKHLND